MTVQGSVSFCAVAGVSFGSLWATSGHAPTAKETAPVVPRGVCT
jgi:hypothetical protein